MNSKIEQLKADQAKQLDAAIKFETAKEAITTHMAALNLTVEMFHPHTCYSDYVAVVTPADDLSAAITIAERLNPETIFKVKDSCTSFVPEHHLDTYLTKHPNAKPDDYTAAYIYQIEGIRGYPDTKELHCYVVAAGYTFRVEIPVKNDPDTRRDYEITFNRRGEATRQYCRLINKSGHFLKSVTWWSSQDQPSNYTLY